MAIVQQDPRLKEEQEEAQKAGAISGTSGAPTQDINPATQDVQQAPQAAPPSPQGQAQPQQQSAPQAQQQPQRASQAPRSGMATNVQQYVQKNQPQAQKIAGAVTGGITRQTGEIAQQAQQRQKALQQQLATGQEKIGTARSFAQEQIQNIMQSPVDQETSQLEINPEVSERFQSLMQGNIGVQAPENINLAAQQQKLRSLQQLGGGLQTEAGRRAALGQTFGKGRQYTAGQAALDELILGGTPEAQQALRDQTQQAFTGTQQQLQSIQQQAQADVKAQRQALSQLPEEIQRQFTEAETGLETGITGAREKAMAERAALLDPESEEYQQALAQAQADIESRRKLLEGDNYTSLLESLIPQAYQRAASEYGVGRGDAETTNLENYVDALRQFEETGEVTRRVRNPDYSIGSTQEPRYIYETVSGQEAQDYLNQGGGTRVTHHKNRAAISALNDLLSERLGLDQDLYGTGAFGSGAEKGFDYGEDNKRYLQSLSGLRDFYQKQLGGLGSAEEILQSRLAQEAGADFAGLQEGADIGQYELADPQQIQRINALRKLAGKSNIIGQEQVPETDYATAERLRELLSGFGGS